MTMPLCPSSEGLPSSAEFSPTISISICRVEDTVIHESIKEGNNLFWSEMKKPSHSLSVRSYEYAIWKICTSGKHPNDTRV